MTFPFIAELASVLDRAATLLAEHLLGLLQQGGEAAAWQAGPVIHALVGQP